MSISNNVRPQFESSTVQTQTVQWTWLVHFNGHFTRSLLHRVTNYRYSAGVTRNQHIVLMATNRLVSPSRPTGAGVREESNEKLLTNNNVYSKRSGADRDKRRTHKNDDSI